MLHPDSFAQTSFSPLSWRLELAVWLHQVVVRRLSLLVRAVLLMSRIER